MDCDAGNKEENTANEKRKGKYSERTFHFYMQHAKAQTIPSLYRFKKKFEENKIVQFRMNKRNKADNTGTHTSINDGVQNE